MVEYCRYGNIRHYLIKKRKQFIDSLDEGRSRGFHARIYEARQEHARLRRPTSCRYTGSVLDNESNTVDKECEDFDDLPLSTKDLICYAFQIARGMDYLASKNV